MAQYFFSPSCFISSKFDVIFDALFLFTFFFSSFTHSRCTTKFNVSQSIKHHNVTITPETRYYRVIHKKPPVFEGFDFLMYNNYVLSFGTQIKFRHYIRGSEKDLLKNQKLFLKQYFHFRSFFDAIQMKKWVIPGRVD